MDRCLPPVYHSIPHSLLTMSSMTESLHATLSNIPTFSAMVPHHYISKSSFPRFVMKLETRMGNFRIPRPFYATRASAMSLTTGVHPTRDMVPLPFSMGFRCYSTNISTMPQCDRATTLDPVPATGKPCKPSPDNSIAQELIYGKYVTPLTI